MKWALQNEEWYMVNVLFLEFQIGIPGTYLHNLPQKTSYSSVNDFLSVQANMLATNDHYLQEVFYMFRYSKWIHLVEWNNSYGYRYQR